MRAGQCVSGRPREGEGEGGEAGGSGSESVEEEEEEEDDDFDAYYGAADDQDMADDSTVREKQRLVGSHSCSSVWE